MKSILIYENLLHVSEESLFTGPILERRAMHVV